MTEWRKSSYSGGMHDDACVELANLDGRIGIRDSKNVDGGRLELGRASFAGFLRRMKTIECR